MKTLFYQIEYGQQDLINSSAFYTFEEAVDYYDNTPDKCKSNQDSIVCIDQDNKFIDRLDMIDRTWETQQI